MKKQITAYAWASGLIEFGEVYPEGALPVITGDEDAVRELVGTLARHSHSGELLVPGVPESGGGMEAVDALLRFNHRMVEAYSGQSQELES